MKAYGRPYGESYIKLDSEEAIPLNQVPLIIQTEGIKMIQPNSVFDVKFGSKVFNKFTNKYGSVSVRETSHEWIEAFVKWDGDEKEQVLPIPTVPNIKFVED